MRNMAIPLITTDDEVLVDKVITSKKLVGEKLPSFGRDLVPYFVPGCAQMDLGAVNVNTDVDALRRAGGGVLSIPAPATSTERKQKKVTKKKAPRSPAKQVTQARQLGFSASAERAATLAARSTTGSATVPAKAVAEPWAGPAYVNSPPPSSLPVPSFVLVQQGRQSPVAKPIVQSEPTSPLRTGRLFKDSSASSQDVALQFVDRAAIEFSLKRILQVA